LLVVPAVPAHELTTAIGLPLASYIGNLTLSQRR
jgi:hypothetical protein